MKTRRRELSNRRLSPLGRRSVYVIAGDDVPNFFESLGILLRKRHLVGISVVLSETEERPRLRIGSRGAR